MSARRMILAGSRLVTVVAASFSDFQNL